MTETAAELLLRVGQKLQALNLGLAAEMTWNPKLRFEVEQQQAEQSHFGKCLTLGLTADDARMVLDRERAVTAEYRLTREEMWARAWDKAIGHSMGETYRPFRDDTEQFYATARLVANHAAGL